MPVAQSRRSMRSCASALRKVKKSVNRSSPSIEFENGTTSAVDVTRMDVCMESPLDLVALKRVILFCEAFMKADNDR